MSKGRFANGSAVGTVAAVVVSVIWGLSFVAARVALSTLTPLLLATLRFSIASLTFTPVILSEFRRGHRLTLRDFAELAILGVMSITVYFWLQYIGVSYAGAGVSAILVVGLIPIITGLASSFVLKEKLSGQRTLGIALGLSGVVLIALPKLLLGTVDLLFFLGLVSLVSDAILFSFYSALSRRLIARVERPMTVTAYTVVLGTLALIPLSLGSDWNLAAALQTEQWISILYLALVCSCLGYFLWNFALSRLEAVKASVWLYLEPVAAFTGEALIFSVMPTPATLIGAAAIIIGALMTSQSPG